MAATRWTIEGRIFQKKTDYDAALRDLEKLDKIRKQVNFNNYNDVMKLFLLVQSNEYHFESILGRDFDDEIYELVEELKKNKTPNKGKSNKGKSNKGKSNKGKLNKENKNSKKVIKLEDYDEDFRKEIIIQIKSREKRRKIMITCFSSIAALCIGYFLFYSYMTDKNQKEFEQLASLKEISSTGNSNSSITITAEGEIEIPDILEQYKILYNKNKKLIGWIKIDDTNIDYPVMQSSSSEYYLDHNFNQEYDKNGSIFLDPQCNILDRSDNLIVYGHHMQSGKMFGSLEKYSDEGFYEKHPTISFDTIYEEGNYQIMYVFRSRIYNEDEVVFKYYQFFNASSETEFNSNMEEMSNISLYDTGVTARYGDKLLTLSTCDYQETNGRFVVIAKKIP